ncbi:MAG: diacylglycerol kinase family lipid kinase [Candidatus Sumerlaeaceae bacterium]|nr:diacylglycerol kinase family lipid kinase [Candidatus Sumerlaeaceae bacterium]
MSIFLIINTWGGRRQPAPRLIRGLQEVLSRSGTRHEIALSQSIDHSAQLVERAAQEGFDTLWIGGGDGTVHVILNQSAGRGFAYGLLPMGTVNALADSLGIPADPLAAADFLIAAQPVQVDVGRVNGLYFLCFASVGFDAAVVHSVSDTAKERFGRFSYALAGLKAAAGRVQVPRFELHIPTQNGLTAEPLAGHSLVVSHISNYAGMRLFPHAQPMSGAMELALIPSPGASGYLGWFLSAMARMPALARRTGVTMRSEAAFTLTSERPLSLQLDGEPVTPPNPTRLQFECLPGAARLLLRRTNKSG